jgi:hypothetical protein
MTQQQLFNTVVTHLVTQRAPAIETIGGVSRPRLRMHDGKKCAFGVLIPDDRYNFELEFSGAVSGLQAERLLSAAGLEKTTGLSRLVTDLMDLHDEPTNWDATGFIAFDKAETIARTAGLDPWVVTTLKEAQKAGA